VVTGPLAGVRVVEFAAVVSGPMATMWLADQGADVVKIEPLEIGDVTRATLGAPDLGGLAGLFVNCNRGKRSLAIDVASDQGHQIVLDLCRSADVFVQNWRPGVVDRIGLGYEDVAAVRPDIIYVSISGFGPDGPYAHRRVYDPIVQGLTGIVSAQTNPELPFPDLVRTLVCDKATALAVAQGVCAALFARDRGAGGQHLIIPMLDTALAFFFPDGYMARALVDDPKVATRPTMTSVYRVSRTADGYLIIYCATRSEEFALFRALGHPEWAEDERFSTPVERRRNSQALAELVTGAVETFTTSELSSRLEAEQVPFAPVLSLEEVPNDPQIGHNGALRTRDHPVAGRVLEAVPPIRFSGTPTELTPLAPSLGQHDDEVLRELGHSDDAIAALRAAGVIG
jgi:crotonobetainyl-CoA:carnitine CoA-transferase CaiB-like acyl-CoA transferase